MPILDISFATTVIHWRGPLTVFFFAPVPADHATAIREAARTVSYGWGMVPCAIEIRGQAFTTALFPKNGGYLIPLKDKVRAGMDVSIGDAIDVTLRISARR